MTKIVTTLLAALGLAYACLWWSYQRFYGEFGVSPQDVGLAPSSSAADLPGAALQLGIWLVVVLAVMTALPVGAVLAVEIGRACDPPARHRARVWYGAAVALLALTGGLYWWLVDGWKGIGVLVGAVLVFAVLAYLGRLIDLPDDTEGGKKLAAVKQALPVTVPRLAIAVALASAVAGITFLDLPSDAAEAGKCATNEKMSVPGLNLPFPGLRLPILSVHAQPATLTWLGSQSPQDIPTQTRVVYLGQANGNVVVYDHERRRTFRIPAGNVAVAVDTSAEPCPSVHAGK